MKLRPWTVPRLGIVARYVIVLTVFAVLPLAASIAVGSIASARLITHNVEQRLQAVADLQVAQARAVAATRGADARMSARLAEDLAELIEAELQAAPVNGELSDELRQRAGRWLRVQAHMLGDDVDLVLLTLDGKEIARSTLHTASAADWSGRLGILEGRTRTWTSDLGYEGPSGLALSAVTTPLRTPAGRPVGELVLLEDRDTLGKGLPTDLGLQVSLELHGGDGQLLATWPQDVVPSIDDIAARASLRPGGSYLIVRSPRSHALAALMTLRTVGISGLVGGTLISLLVATWLGRRMTWPLMHLIAVTRRIGVGNLDPYQVSVAGDEIGDLSRSVDDMRRALVAARQSQQALLHRRTLALEASQGLIASLFEVLPELVIVIDASRTIVEANGTARRLHGGLMVGDRCHRVLYGLETICEGCPLDSAQGVVGDDRPPTIENRFGEVMAFRLQEIALRPGTPQAWVYTGRIETESRRLRAQVVHQEKMAMTGVLAAGVAHEIGNPLASLMALLQVAERSDEGLSNLQLDLLQQQVRRITSAVHGLLGVARTSSSEAGPMVVNRVVERAVQLVRYDPRSPADGVSFVPDPEIPVAWGIEDRLLQALLNILINAIDAVEGQAGAAVMVTTSPAPGGLEITVCDNGPGMDADTLVQARAPLFTTKPPGRGTGLGLHVTGQILDEMRGTLSIESQPGVGTTVRLVLPEPAIIRTLS